MATRLKAFASRHVRLLIGVGIVLTGLFVFALVADRSPIGVRATAWAASHAASLPQTLEELAAYPPDYRREILKALPPEAKSALWRAQLRKFAADRPTLTAEQVAFVNYAIDVASPESFRPGANPPELCDRVAQLFPKMEDRRLFSKIATGVTPTFAWRSTVLTMTERVREKVFAQAGLGSCTCRGLGMCECGVLEACESSRCAPADDCGCIFLGECNKTCEFILEPSQAARKKK
jgi:hypothetical protein